MGTSYILTYMEIKRGSCANRKVSSRGKPPNQAKLRAPQQLSVPIGTLRMVLIKILPCGKIGFWRARGPHLRPCSIVYSHRNALFLLVLFDWEKRGELRRRTAVIHASGNIREELQCCGWQPTGQQVNRAKTKWLTVCANFPLVSFSLVQPCLQVLNME